MATGETAAPKKARKAQGPRQEKPVFVSIRYTDESGNAVKLDAERLEMTFTKDAGTLLTALTSGGVDISTTTIKQVHLAGPRPSPAQAPVAVAAE